MFMSMFMPAVFAIKFTTIASRPFTLAFSNTPGILRTIEYNGVRTEGMINSFLPSGKIGLSIGMISYCEGIRISATIDTSVSDKPHEILDLVVESVKAYIAKGKAAKSKSD